jgi:hypothetical protein
MGNVEWRTDIRGQRTLFIIISLIVVYVQCRTFNCYADYRGAKTLSRTALSIIIKNVTASITLLQFYQNI